MHFVRHPGGIRVSAVVALVAFASTTLAVDFQRAAFAQGVGATGKQRLLLIPMQRAEDVSSVIPGRVYEYLQTIIEMSDSLEVFTPDTLEVPEEDASKAPEQETDKTLAKADDQLWAAKELAEKGKYMKAVSTFKKAMSLYEKRLAELNDFDKYVDAALGVALSYFLAGYDDNGEDALAPVLVMRPTLVLDKRKVPKAASDALERLQHLYSAAAPGKIEVTSPEPGAEVFVDGVRVGETPHTVTGVYRGKHVVRVTADGYLPWAKAFMATNADQELKAKLRKDPKAAKSEAVELVQSPEGLIQAAAKGIFGRGFLRLAGILADQYSLDAIVLTYLRRQPNHYELATFIYDHKEKQLAELEWIHLDHQLATLQVNLLVLEEKLLSALAAFPASRIVKDTSKIYEVVAPPKPEPKPEPEPEPVVIVQPDPEPQRRPVPVPVVVVQPKPEPKPVPVVVVQPKPEPKPVPVVVVQPRPQPRPEPQVVQPAPRAAEPRPQPQPQPRSSVMHVDDGASRGLGRYDYPDAETDPLAAATYEEPDDDEAGAWYEQWWVWVIAGGVVAGGVTAAVFATQPTNDGSKYRMGVCWGGGCQ